MAESLRMFPPTSHTLLDQVKNGDGETRSLSLEKVQFEIMDVRADAAFIQRYDAAATLLVLGAQPIAVLADGPVTGRPSTVTLPPEGSRMPAMIDSSVLLPEPDAPTIAADCRAAREKSISWRIVSVPVESVTARLT